MITPRQPAGPQIISRYRSAGALIQTAMRDFRSDDVALFDATLGSCTHAQEVAAQVEDRGQQPILKVRDQPSPVSPSTASFQARLLTARCPDRSSSSRQRVILTVLRGRLQNAPITPIRRSLLGWMTLFCTTNTTIGQRKNARITRAMRDEPTFGLSWWTNATRRFRQSTASQVDSPFASPRWSSSGLYD